MRKSAELQSKQKINTGRKPATKHAAEDFGRKLLEVIVYNRSTRAGEKLTVDDLVETSEIGDGRCQILSWPVLTLHPKVGSSSKTIP